MRRLKIRQKVLVTMLGVAAPAVVAFSLLLTGSTEEILAENAARQVSGLADKSAGSLAELVGRSQTALRKISTSPEIGAFLDAAQKGDPRRLRESLARLEGAFLGFQRLDPAIQAIRLVDSAGNVLVKIREGKVIPPEGEPRPPYGVAAVHSVASRDFFSSALALRPGEVLVSNLERGRVEEEEDWCPAMVRFATPLAFPGGENAAVVIVNVWGTEAGNLINRLISPEEGSAFLVERHPSDRRRNGIYLFHQDETCQFGDQTGTNRTVFDDYPSDVTAAWMSTDSGVTSDPRTGDILGHAYFSPYGLPDRGWVVVVNARRSFFLEPLGVIRRRTLLWGGLVLALAAVASFFFARSLTRPIHAVVEGMRRMGSDPGSRIPENSTDETGFLAGEINRMADAIHRQMEEAMKVEEKICQAEKLASVGEMAAGLAHELNTPLSNIRALAVLAKKEIENGACAASLSADLSDIAEQAAKCGGITSGLLNFARSSAPRLAFHELPPIVREALALVRMRAEKKNVIVSFAPPESGIVLKTDGDQLRQVLVNLLLNAVDAVSEKGTVAVEIAALEEWIAIAVRDSGCGIPPEVREKVFDPFFTTKEVGEGTGLGLSVSYGIVKGLGGSIAVVSEPGSGSVFTVRLPARKEEE